MDGLTPSQLEAPTQDQQNIAETRRLAQSHITEIAVENSKETGEELRRQEEVERYRKLRPRRTFKTKDDESKYQRAVVPKLRPARGTAALDSMDCGLWLTSAFRYTRQAPVGPRL